MSQLKTPLLIGLVLITLACSSLPLGAGVVQPSAPVATEIPLAGSDATSSPEATGALTPIKLHVGRGVHGSWFDLYFTDPADPAGRESTGGLDEPLIAAIDAARLSIHAAIYSLSLDNVRTALIRAHRRGVDVRLVTESDNLEGDDLQRLIEAGVPVLGDRREGTMHDKFMVIDNLQVWTGSMNYTGSGVYSDNNCLIRISSGRLAQMYESEFSEMFDQDLFGPQSGSAAPAPSLQIGGSSLDLRFAPEDHPEAELVNLIDTATSSVEFLAFSFTSDGLGGALLRAHQAGLLVRGVMDEDQSFSNVGTELTSFRAAGLDVRLDGNPGQMHEKVLIIDGEIVVLGSYNFSRSANESNDENLLIVHDPEIAGQFVDEFARIYAISAP